MQKDSKSLIRNFYISKRDSLTPEERSQKSCLISERVFKLFEFQQAHICLLYASFRSEVETDYLITTLLEKGKRLALPVTDRANKRLVLCEILYGLGDLVPSVFGIREPQPNNTHILPPSAIDLFILPGVAFDCTGTRIGYGGGYYDRLLAHVETKNIIALAYETQIAPSLPFDKSDIRVKKVVTEARVIECMKVPEQLCKSNL